MFAVAWVSFWSEMVETKKKCEMSSCTTFWRLYYKLLSGNEHLDVVCFQYLWYSIHPVYVSFPWWPLFSASETLLVKNITQHCNFYHLKPCIIPFLTRPLKTSHSPLSRVLVHCAPPPPSPNSYGSLSICKKWLSTCTGHFENQKIHLTRPSISTVSSKWNTLRVSFSIKLKDRSRVRPLIWLISFKSLCPLIGSAVPFCKMDSLLLFL